MQPWRVPSQYKPANDAARPARSNHPAGVRAYTDSVISTFLPPDAGTRPLREKLNLLESNYRAEAVRPVTEEDIVRAVNAFAGRVGAPEYAQTSTSQVRFLRASLVRLAPDIMGGVIEEPDRIHNEMSPAQAAFVIGVLAQQKLTNELFQLSPAEWNDRPAALPEQARGGTPPRFSVHGESGRGHVLRNRLSEFGRHQTPAGLDRELDLFITELYG